jgi:hypothetical protein
MIGIGLLLIAFCSLFWSCVIIPLIGWIFLRIIIPADAKDLTLCFVSGFLLQFFLAIIIIGITFTVMGI